jgi:cell division protein FtsI (penicillin-binding protein 3)
MTKERQLELLRSRRANFRVHLLMVLFVCALLLLAGRAVQLQIIDNDFLVEQGQVRHVRIEKLSAHRGSITDRHGEDLALSTPVDAITVNPKVLREHEHKTNEDGTIDEAVAARHEQELPALARAVGVDHDWLLRQITTRAEKQFMYLRRGLSPDRAADVLALGIPGVHSEREYRRYYPAREVTAHVLGFTDIDDHGLEGLELAFEYWLQGHPGVKRVLRDSLGRSVEDVESVRPPEPGRTLITSIDLRLQYVAHRSLQAAVARHRAASGSVVILDVASGEVLAMVNQPSYNPNDRGSYKADKYRNRAVTDIFEPGSAFKTMVVAAALESGKWRADSPVDTSPGYVEVGGKTIKDTGNLGMIDVRTVLVRSSNVGITRIAQTLEPRQLWQVLSDLGFGQLTASGFPGESAGLLRDYRHWRSIGQATLSYGYGLSVTPLQLAQGYATIANGGLRAPVSFVRQESAPRTERVLSPQTAASLVSMLEHVVLPGGTGLRAAVPGYRIAGKTGTARKSAGGGYATDRYVSVFAGLAPVSDPRLAIVVMIDDPAAGDYYGGAVAAPVFSQITADALRLLAVPPDDPALRTLAAGDGELAGARADAGRPPAAADPDDTLEAVP